MVPSLQMHIDLVQGLQIVIPQVLETLDQLHGIQLLSLIRDFYLQVDIDLVQGLQIVVTQVLETLDHFHDVQLLSSGSFCLRFPLATIY